MALQKPITLTTLRSRLRKEASAKRIPRELVDEALAITVRSLGLSPRVTASEVRRARSYFWAVLRRTSMRPGGDEYLRGKFLLSSIIVDLRQSGFSDRRILADLERDWASRVPALVMDEFRDRLAMEHAS